MYVYSDVYSVNVYMCIVYGDLHRYYSYTHVGLYMYMMYIMYMHV